MKLVQLLPLLVFLLALVSCNVEKTEDKPVKMATIDHVVFLWVDDTLSAEIMDSIKLHSSRLDTIPGIISLSQGEAIPSERPIVDDSFDLGLIFTFANKEDMDNYVSHKGHVNFVKKWVKPYSTKLTVYDIKRD